MASIYRQMMEQHHWTPAEIGAIPWCQLLLLWSDVGRPREMSGAEFVALQNEQRARQGLSPVEPRKRDGR